MGGIVCVRFKVMFAFKQHIYSISNIWKTAQLQTTFQRVLSDVLFSSMETVEAYVFDALIPTNPVRPGDSEYMRADAAALSTVAVCFP